MNKEFLIKAWNLDRHYWEQYISDVPPEHRIDFTYRNWLVMKLNEVEERTSYEFYQPECHGEL